MNSDVSPWITLALALLQVMSEPGVRSATAEDPGDVVALRGKGLTESSGLAFSIRDPRCVWSHNDSGGKSELFAFDRTGRMTGRCNLKSTDAEDWEAMASFTQAGIPRLLIADCGDNDAGRGSIKLHLIDEPDPDRSTETRKIDTLKVTFPEGPQDCEAVLVDAVRRQIVLVTKRRFPAAGIYVVPLPDRGKTSEAKVTAKRVGTLALPMVTGMDIEPNSGDIWIVNYFQAFRFSCRSREEPIGRQLGRTPRGVDLPRLRQIEAVAIDRDGRVWVTSEGSPARMAPVRPE